jgi:hypothetical protein
MAAAGVVAGVLLVSACSSSPHEDARPTHSTTTTGPEAPTTPTPEGLEAHATQEIKKQVKSAAIEAALGMLSVLSDPRAGAKSGEYRLDNQEAAAANKSQHAGFPEITAVYNPNLSTLDVHARSERPLTANSSSVWAANTLFIVGPNNPLAHKSSQLSVDDFRHALQDSDSIEIMAASAMENGSSDPAAQEGAGISVSFGAPTKGSGESTANYSYATNHKSDLQGAAEQLDDLLGSVINQYAVDIRS